MQHGFSSRRCVTCNIFCCLCNEHVLVGNGVHPPRLYACCNRRDIALLLVIAVVCRFMLWAVSVTVGNDQECCISYPWIVPYLRNYLETPGINFCVLTALVVLLSPTIIRQIRQPDRAV